MYALYEIECVCVRERVINSALANDTKMLVVAITININGTYLQQCPKITTNNSNNNSNITDWR